MFRPAAIVLFLVFVLACTPTPVVVLGPEDCTNKIDDNGDGKVDCNDPKCAETDTCLQVAEMCDNDIDDNGDGNVDCKDAQCIGKGCGADCTCIGGLKVRVEPDGGPNPFSFPDVTGVDAKVAVTSSIVTPTGFSGPLTVTCNGCTELAKNGVFAGATISGFQPGDTITARANSGDYGSTVAVTVTLGSTVSAPWHITSRSAPLSWGTEPWMACSTLCGTGTQHRQVDCKNEFGANVPDVNCTAPKPADSQACTETSGCASCTFSGTVIKHGERITAYLDPNPAGGCSSQERKCTNGNLSGAYSYASCLVGCALPWGGVIRSGESVTAFSIEFGGSFYCENNSQQRACNDGHLTGDSVSYPFQTCINYPCPMDGANFEHEEISFASSAMTIHDPTALQCDGPHKAFSTVTSTGPWDFPCQFGSRWYLKNTCGTFDGKIYRCVRVTEDGGLSGDFVRGDWRESTGCPQSLP